MVSMPSERFSQHRERAGARNGKPPVNGRAASAQNHVSHEDLPGLHSSGRIAFANPKP
jgi:hypothetical protein